MADRCHLQGNLDTLKPIPTNIALEILVIGRETENGRGSGVMRKKSMAERGPVRSTSPQGNIGFREDSMWGTTVTIRDHHRLQVWHTGNLIHHLLHLADILPMQRPPSGNMLNPTKRLHTRNGQRRHTQHALRAPLVNTLPTREVPSHDMAAVHMVENPHDPRNRKLSQLSLPLETDVMLHRTLAWDRGCILYQFQLDITVAPH